MSEAKAALPMPATAAGREKMLDNLLPGIFREAVFDTELLSHAKNIASLETMIQAHEGRFKTPDADFLKNAIEMHKDCIKRDKSIDPEKFKELGQFLENGFDTEKRLREVSKELLPFHKEHRDAIKAETQRIYQAENIMTKRDALNYVRALGQAVNDLIKDPDLRAGLADLFTRYSQSGTGSNALPRRSEEK